ncbi:MAG: hypothetical protein JO002_08705, partial [Burkholderiaceae bacterium]|nr:hypothetical protein [Burkholderiaceae bacterium]
KKQDIVLRLRRDLQAAAVERLVAAKDAEAAASRTALRRFQSARMAQTHADLLADPNTRGAAHFFLDDLYGTHDFTQRDADIERIIPMMEKLLPVSALRTIAEAIELDALSEILDRAMATRLGNRVTEPGYIEAYREGMRRDREKQIEHIRSVGDALCELVRIPLISGTLAMMRAPARLAGLSELHDFLDRGFRAFKQMRRPKEFVDTIVRRETAIMERLFGGASEPFA